MSFYAARKKSGMTQQQASEKLGVTKVSVCNWETGRCNPRAGLIPKIASLYHCKAEELLKGNPTFYGKGADE